MNFWPVAGHRAREPAWFRVVDD